MLPSIALSPVFKGIDPDVVGHLLDEAGYSARQYASGDVIALKGSRLSSLMIVAEGVVAAETADPAGKTLKIDSIKAPALVTPFCLYAPNNVLPVNIAARTPVVIVQVGRDAFTSMLMRERRLLENFLEIISSRDKILSDRVVYLAYKTIKGKFANYLLNKMETEGMSFRNDLSQREMAELFGVTRPALARAIGEMCAEGAIYVSSKNITILFAEKLKQYAKN